MLQNATLLRKSALTSLLVPRLPGKMHLCSSFSNVPRLPTLLKLLQTLTLCSLLTRCRIFCTGPRETTSERPKVFRACGVLHILTWKCASRHNGVHFFDISNFKSAPNLVCFAHFDLETCFAPQQQRFFNISIFQNCSEPVSFLHSSLPNVLRATTACNFSTSQLPEVLRARCVLYVLTSTCASRYDGVPNFSFLIWPDSSAPAALASLLFDPPEPQIIWKTQWLGTFLPFRAPAFSFLWSSLFFFILLYLFFILLFSSLFFSSLLLSSLFFSSLLYSSLLFFILLFSSLLFFILLFSSLLFFILLFSSLLFSFLLRLFPPLLSYLSILSEVWLLNFLRSLFFLLIFVFFWDRLKPGFAQNKIHHQES